MGFPVIATKCATNAELYRIAALHSLDTPVDLMMTALENRKVPIDSSACCNTGIGASLDQENIVFVARTGTRLFSGSTIKLSATLKSWFAELKSPSSIWRTARLFRCTGFESWGHMVLHWCLCWWYWWFWWNEPNLKLVDQYEMQRLALYQTQDQRENVNLLYNTIIQEPREPKPHSVSERECDHTR